MYERIISWDILNQVGQKLTVGQHGFLSGRSCTSNLLESLDYILDCTEDNQGADILYFDFSKAFDSVSHYRLLVKMKCLGVNYSTCNKAYSKPKAVLSGVPQDLVLGPVLFLMSVNDIPESITSFVRMFADDVKMIVKSRDLQNTQEDLNTLQIWQNVWELDFLI